MYPDTHLDRMWVGGVRKKAEQSYPLAGLSTYGAHRGKAPTLGCLHDRLNTFKHLDFLIWLRPEQSRIEGRVPGGCPKGPSISHCQRPERQPTGVNKLQFCGQVFEIDLHLELQWSMISARDPASQARSKRRCRGPDWSAVSTRMPMAAA
jgi:hypothetical protein